MAAMPRVGVIGTGHWGRNLLRNFDSLGALAALCDVAPERLGALSEEFPEATAFADHHALFNGHGIDAVAIATPAATHGTLVAEALDAGKHVFVEKPLCLDIAEGRHLADCAAQAGTTLMVGHLLLYHPAFIALREDGPITRGPRVRSPYSAVSEIENRMPAIPDSTMRSTINLSSCKHSKYAISG